MIMALSCQKVLLHRVKVKLCCLCCKPLSGVASCTGSCAALSSGSCTAFTAVSYANPGLTRPFLCLEHPFHLVLLDKTPLSYPLLCNALPVFSIPFCQPLALHFLPCIITNSILHCNYFLSSLFSFS